MKPIAKNLNKPIFKICLMMLFTCVYCFEVSAQIQYTYDAAGNRTQRKLAVRTPQTYTTNSSNPDTVQAMKVAMDNGISVYPNPTNDMVNVTVSTANSDKKAIAYLVDNTGRILFSKEVNSTPFPIDLKDYVPGIYFIRVIIGKEKLSYQIIKSK